MFDTHTFGIDSETVLLTHRTANSISIWFFPRTNHCRRYVPPHAKDGEQGAFQHLGAVRCARADWQLTVRRKAQIHMSCLLVTVSPQRWYTSQRCEILLGARLLSPSCRSMVLTRTTSATLKCLNNRQFAHGLVCATETYWCQIHILEILQKQTPNHVWLASGGSNL